MEPQPSRSGIASGAMIAAAVGLLALPSAVLAFTSRFEAKTPAPKSRALENQAPIEKLARPSVIRSLAKGQLFLFTPADTPTRPDRAINVAVRIDAVAAKAISVRGYRPAIASAEEARTPTIAPTAFNLGVARGYRNLTQSLVPSAHKGAARLPELGRYSLAPGRASDDSRFAPRIVIDETQAAGRTPRTFAGDSDERVDVGGSYRLTKNLDVTAGVRYSQQRERLSTPLTDGQQDSQAVYVGTQFRF